jgi:hypothetical protein
MDSQNFYMDICFGLHKFCQFMWSCWVRKLRTVTAWMDIKAFLKIDFLQKSTAHFKNIDESKDYFKMSNQLVNSNKH